MSIKKKVGDKLNLNLQLHDGVDTMPKRVFVDLIDNEGNAVETDLEIMHLSGGLFLEDTQVMPDVPTLFARFSVFDADGTTPSVDHSEAKDRYEKELPIELPDAIIPKPFAIKARVRNVRIKARVRNE